MTKHPDHLMNYSAFVQSRAKAPEAIQATLTPDKIDAMHAVWGITGEVMEYYLAPTVNNQIEELHDIGFYIQMLENRFGVVTVAPPPEFSQDPGAENIFNSPMNLMRATNDLFDLAKKVIVYNDESKLEAVLKTFSFLKYQWVLKLNQHGITEEEAHLLNQNKLIKRYANGYSDAAAATRADKQPGE